MSSTTYYDDQGRWRVRVAPGEPEHVHDVVVQLERSVAAGERLAPSPAVLARLLDTARRDAGFPSQRMLAALQIRAQQAGLTRDDRLQLAEVLLRRDVDSWRDLTLADAQTLMAALEGFALIAHLQAEQGRRWRYGRCPAAVCPMRDPLPDDSQQT